VPVPVDEDQDPGERAAQLHELAISRREAGSYLEAEAACREAVAIFEATEGPRSPNLANALVEHGRLLELLDRIAEAGPAIDRALAILRPLVDRQVASRAPAPARASQSENQADQEDPALLEELVRLTVRAETSRASAYRTAGRLSLAEAGYRRALSLAEAGLSAKDSLVAEALNGLGVVHKFQGRYDEAEPIYRRALAIVEAEGHEDDVATLLHNLGGLAHARGDFAMGEPLARRSVEIHERLLGADHPTTAADRAAWGALLEGLGRSGEAERAYSDALAVFEARLGPGSLETASALTALGAVQHARGALEDAERSYRRSLEIRIGALGPSHFDIGLTLNNLAMVLVDRGAKAEAASTLARAQAVFAAELGPDHPHTRAIADNIAALDAKLQ
jgi:tetratricopeptide (TPR) repeat protein